MTGVQTCALPISDCGAFRLALEDFLVQHQLPASSAHLSAWLRELYAERVADEANPAHLDQLGEDADLDARSNSSRSSSSDLRALTQSNVLSPAAAVPAPTTRTVQPEPSRRSGAWRWAVLGLGMSLLSAGAALLLLRQDAASAPASVTASAPVSVPAVVPVPRPPEPVMIRVDSEPEGARVEVDGTPQGETPVTLPLGPGAAPVSVALRMEGYEPTTRRVSAADAPALSVKLHARPAAPRPPRHEASAPPLDIKLGR